MTTQFDLLFVDIFHSFLDTAASRAVGVPPAADCALLKMDSDADDKDPRICITAEMEGTGHSKSINVIAVSRGTQPRSITGPWLAKIGDRMADEAALMAHLASLPLAQRTGWQCEHLSPPMPARILREDGGISESGIGVRLLITVA
ncbi:MAG TPA: hypothetical protein DDZ88_16445 [Verrucomicrobiales bacterium]|nr:hypothetical protein [Verrucomicrobiales bacterium]